MKLLYDDCVGDVVECTEQFSAGDFYDRLTALLAKTNTLSKEARAELDRYWTVVLAHPESSLVGYGEVDDLLVVHYNTAVCESYEQTADIKQRIEDYRKQRVELIGRINKLLPDTHFSV